MPFQADVWLPHALAVLARDDRPRFEALVFKLAEALPAEFQLLTTIASEHPDCMHTVRPADMAHGLFIVSDERGVARIADTHVAVWEIVRVYRRVGSIEALKESYNGLSERELRDALAYACNNPDEISNQIEKYEASKRARQALGFGNSAVVSDESFVS